MTHNPVFQDLLLAAAALAAIVVPTFVNILRAPRKIDEQLPARYPSRQQGKLATR